MSEAASRYLDGDYLTSTGGSWHLEDAPFKAAQVAKMVAKHGLTPRTVSEIGCGAGGILAELQKQMSADVEFVGYEISPQAHEISRQFANDRLSFVLGDAFAAGRHADLVLVMDVVEHVEDCFGFLRKVRAAGELKMYHIPLDIHCSATVRDSYLNAWKSVGHIHVFSLATALESLRYTGHEVIDYFLTPCAFAGNKALKTRAVNLIRRLFPPKVTARLLGGYEVLILAR